jgi:hypothetical protein
LISISIAKIISTWSCHGWTLDSGSTNFVATATVFDETAGFELLEEPRLLQRVPYCRDQRSMMRVEFDTVFWVHRKKAAAATRDS